MNKLVIHIVASLVLAGGALCAFVPPSATAADQPVAPTWQPPEVAEFSLEECHGKTVTKKDLLGRPWLASFIFIHCAGPCPRVTEQVKRLHDRFKDKDIRFVTFTVDPERDTPEALAEYASNFGADPERWSFLTGDKREIYDLIHHSFLMPVFEEEGERRVPGNEIFHSTNLMYVDAEGRVRGKYDAQDDVAMVKLRRVLEGKAEPSFTGFPMPGSGADKVPTDDDGDETTGSDDGSGAAGKIPAWVQRLPATNAALNALATCLLIAGYLLIKSGRRQAHETAMLSAFVTSTLFLACYLVYHFALHHYTGASSRKFGGTGVVLYVYRSILASHILLAFTVPVLALVTIYRGLREQWDRHRRIARICWPIWLYVSITGVIIYWMLYHSRWHIG